MSQGPTSSVPSINSSLDASNTFTDGNSSAGDMCFIRKDIDHQTINKQSPFVLGLPNTQDMVHCSSSGCVICHNVNVESVFEGYTNKKKFSSLRSQVLDCKATNLIYLISCAKCGQQYVGETKRSLAVRMKEHRNNVMKGEAGTYLVDHFKQSNHSVEDMKFTIIEHFGQTTMTKQQREEKEDFWIRALVTAYPFGMNDKIRGYGIISKGLDPINHPKHPYFCTKFPPRRRDRGKRKRSKKFIDVKKVTDTMELLKDPVYSVREQYIRLNRLSIKEIVQLMKQLQNGDCNLSNKNQLIVQAVTASKVGTTCKNPSQKLPKLIITAEFKNKAMEAINLPTVFKDHRIIKELGIKKTELGDIIIAYKYKLPAGAKIFNHSKTLRNINPAELSEIMDKTCDCNSSSFNYKPVGHVISGSTEITKNKMLQKIFKLGAKHRTAAEINWDEIRESTEEVLRQLRQKLINRLCNKVAPEKIENVLALCQSIINKRIERSSSIPIFNPTHIQMGNDQISEINKLKKKFIIAPADKAANNYIFVCKKFYLQVMCQELGVSRNPASKIWEALGNAVYSPVNMDKNQLIKQHEIDSATFGVEILEENRTLPIIYAIPKLHKNPYKFRFIAGASKSSLKPISIVLTKILTHVREWFRRYCKNCNFNGSWSINSSLEVLQAIKWKNNWKNITTADFSSMYTSLPHDLVLKEICSLLQMIIKDKYFCVGYTACYCSETPGTKVKAYRVQELQEMVKMVLDNTYVQFAGFIFRQTSGIPMGGNASPLLADLTMSMLEFKYMKQANVELRASIGLCMRYIDDILNLNGKEFLIKSKDIYPTCLPLEDTTIDSRNSNFLDLSLHIKEGKLQSTLYNKVDAFNFEVIRMPDHSSDIHSQVGYNVFYSQLIRTVRVCSTIPELNNKIGNLCQTFITKNYDKNILLKKSKQFIANYRPVYLCLGISSKQMLEVFTQFL